MKIIGITGGVGAGKSTILRYIENNYNAKIIMADEVAKDIERPENECYLKIVELFGTGILTSDCVIDKNILAGIIFEDQLKRKKLNDIVHPLVKEHIVRSINTERELGNIDYMIIEAALLIEDNYSAICDEMWYIYAEENNRRERLKKTRGYTDEKIDAIFKSQLTDMEFRRNCQVVIDNNLSTESTFRQIDKAMIGGY